MASYNTQKSVVSIEDVGGSFKRMVTEAPKLARKLMGTAVFLTARRVLHHMEINAPMGSDGQGATPDEHIKLDLEENWKATRPLSALVGILGNGQFGASDNLQAHVALFNEFAPNKQPFMRPAALASEASFQKDAIAALQALEKKLADGVRG